MKRTPWEERPEVDTLRPITPDTKDGQGHELRGYMKEDDCFGSMWDPTTKECSMCAVQDICGVLTDQNKDRDRGKKRTLDRVDMSRIDRDSIREWVEHCEKEGEPIETKEVARYIKEKTGVRDNDTVKTVIRQILAEEPAIYSEKGQLRWNG